MNNNTSKKLTDLTKFLAPSDLLPISIVVGGALLAILNDVTAFRLIGIGASVVGLISIFMIISQRMNEYVDTRYKSKTPPPNFNITTKKDTTATRQTFEDFVDSMKEEDKKEIKESDFSNSTHTSEEGFRVVNKKIDKKSSETKKKVEAKNTEVKNIAKSSEDKIVVKMEQSKLVFGDEEDIPEMPSNYNPIQKKKEDKEPQNESKKVDEKVIDKNLENNQEDVELEPVSLENEVQEIESNEVQNQTQVELVKKQKETRKIEGLSADFLKQDPIDNLSDPKQEFEYCINRILNAIKSVGSIGTTALFMVNHANNEFKLESFTTNLGADKITNKKKFAFRNDIISQIISNSKPEILSEINPNSELELIPYYVDKVGISSFIGVPIYYREDIIGVLTADSEYADGFDSATVNYFSHFTRLIAILIHNYVEKYDLFQSQKTLKALHKFRMNNYSSNGDDIGIDLFNTVVDIVSMSFAGIVLWNEEEGSWVLTHFAPDDSNSLVNLSIETSSLISNVIEDGMPVYKKSLESNEFLFNSEEAIPDFKKLVLIPIHSSNVTYGVLVAGSDNMEDLSDADIDIVELLCDYAGYAFERYQLMNVLNENSYVDKETGLLNQLAYNERIEEEYIRASEFDRDLTLCLINIDKYSAYDDEKYVEKMELMFYNTLRVINRLKRKFDIIAKNDNQYIAVIMPETKIDTAKFWSEKLRNEIATSILDINGKTFNQTISIGVASIRNSDSLSEFLDNADIALKNSMEKTNTVTLFN